jgi:type IV pilus assembly protein PilP
MMLAFVLTLAASPPEAPVVPAAPVAVVSAVERRDPFASFIDGGPPPDERATPLEKVRLEQLKLTGVVLGASPKALFEGPDGRGYIARIGDGIGTNHGRIEKITASGVHVVETYRNGIGGIERDRTTLPAPTSVRTAQR